MKKLKNILCEVMRGEDASLIAQKSRALRSFIEKMECKLTKAAKCLKRTHRKINIFFLNVNINHLFNKFILHILCLFILNDVYSSLDDQVRQCLPVCTQTGAHM